MISAGLGMGTAASRIYGSGAEFGAAKAYGYRDSLGHVLPIHRKHSRCGNFRKYPLTHYHHDFARVVPSNIPKEAVAAFSIRCCCRNCIPAGGDFQQIRKWFRAARDDVRQCGVLLLGGIQSIFMISAVLMVLLCILNTMIKDVPLRHGPQSDSEQGPAELL
jgi:hypothetical protein